MKVFVTGVRGQLGYDVVNELEKRGHEAVGVDIEELDITDAAAVEKMIKEIAPDAVIHCAAWTAVDAAEDNVDKCRQVNANGTENIAKVCKELDCKMMYISTDYIFDGKGTRPWEPDDPVTTPLNVYGQTKYEGELAVRANVQKFFIVRIAWVFGKGKNFIKTMLNVGKTHDALTVVTDQIGTPTYTFDLARLLVDMLETEKYGYYHATAVNLCGESEESNKIQITLTAVQGLSEADAPAVYPNPATDAIHVQAQQDILLARMHDQSGRTVMEAEGNSLQELTLPVSRLETGNYVLRVQTSSGWFTYKIVIR